MVLAVCGNGWVVAGMIRHLEGQYLPPQSMPTADAILVLSGGVLGRTPPRQSVEIGDAGDRILYGAELYRQGKAPNIICTGNVATGGLAPRPAAEDMAELLRLLGIPASAIATEIKSENTHDHAVNLCPLLQERQMHRVLLVTSAMHMPRSVGVFRRLCPAIEFVPAPTDFRVPFGLPARGSGTSSIRCRLPSPGGFHERQSRIHRAGVLPDQRVALIRRKTYPQKTPKTQKAHLVQRPACLAFSSSLSFRNRAALL